MYALLLDGSIQPTEVVAVNVFQMYVVAFMKIHVHVRALSRPRQRGCPVRGGITGHGRVSPALLLETIEESLVQGYQLALRATVGRYGHIGCTLPLTAIEFRYVALRAIALVMGLKPTKLSQRGVQGGRGTGSDGAEAHGSNELEGARGDSGTNGGRSGGGGGSGTKGASAPPPSPANGGTPFIDVLASVRAEIARLEKADPAHPHGTGRLARCLEVEETVGAPAFFQDVAF